MVRSDLLALLLACAAIPVGAALMAAPIKYPSMPHVWIDVCFYGGIAATLALLIVAALVATHSERHLSAIGMVIFGCLFLFCAGWYFSPHSSTTQHEEPIKADQAIDNVALPEINIRIIGPKSPALVIENNSNYVATQIKWSVGIWNLDDPRTYINTDQDQDIHDPLPIPTQTFDFLRPHTFSAPQNLFNSQQIAPLVKHGQRLFGSLSAVCPTCRKGITVIFYAEYGTGGWYYYDNGFTEGQLIVPISGKKDAIRKFYDQLNVSIPLKDRINIPDN